MAEASKVSGEKYRRIFSEYDPVFVDAVSSAALSLYFGMHREDKPRQTKRLARSFNSLFPQSANLNLQFGFQLYISTLMDHSHYIAESILYLVQSKHLQRTIFCVFHFP